MSFAASHADAFERVVSAPKPTPSAAAARLAAAGTVLFGHRFHAALANELQVSRPLVFAMVNGQRRVTPEIEKRLAATIRSRILPGLESKIRTLSSLADAIDDKLGAYQLPRADAETLGSVRGAS
ncbi:hypothetical protein [Methylopila sp. M107]|uniref:hypothetical protein n=1 Tax=Methylopila sp. M107 TaxID=1101190 RepID=UPI0003672C0E|nr:hypothetical protein [Methylopila sp. M107]